MDHPLMTVLARGLSEAGFAVVRFEFPYMRRRRTEGVRAGPNRLPRLQQALRRVARDLDPTRLVLAGKSMGGRVSATLVDELGAQALLVFGYPFHPLGKPDQLRLEPLQGLLAPGLILQGERDRMVDRTTVTGLWPQVSAGLRLTWLPDGDHSFKPRKASGHTHMGNLQRASELAADFLWSQLDG